MRRGSVASALMVMVALILTLPAQAWQRNIGPGGAGPRPNAVRSYVACAASQVASAGAQQTPAGPFAQGQVQAMVRDGLADETGAKALAQRGIDFAPTEDFLQSLKAAGASEAFLAALRAPKVVAPGLSPAGNVAPTLSV